MKIVTIEELLKAPPNTAYTTFNNAAFGDILIKVDTQSNGTWKSIPLFDATTTPEQTLSDVIRDALSGDRKIPVEFDVPFATSKSSFGSQVQFIILDKDEVRNIASILLESVQQGPTKKIIWKDNFDRDVYAETVVAQNVPAHVAKEMVEAWQKEHWHSHSDSYLAVVDNDYVLYDGYKEMYGG